MLLYLQLPFYITTNVVMLYLINIAFNIFLKPKNNSITKILSYFSYLFLGVLSNFLTSVTWLNILLSIILMFLVSLNFHGTIKRKIVIIFSGVSFLIITEILVGAVFVTIIGQTLGTVVDNGLSNIIAVVIHLLMLLIIVKYSELYISRNRTSEPINALDSLNICLVPLSSICIIYFFLQLSLTYMIDSVNYSFLICTCILIILMNVFFFMLFDKLKSTEKLKYENAFLKNQSEYFTKLEENANNTFEKIRTIKHDLKHQLLFLKAKAEENSNTSLSDIGKILDNMIEDTLSEKQIEYTKNKTINRLLNYKLYAADKKNIEVDVKVSIREDTNIDNISLYTILGNAIDNSLISFDSSNSSMKNIVIRIVDDNDNLFIRVANPYNKKLKFKNGLPITDKPNKELHGIGLQSIKNLAEHKNGHFKITATDNIFTLDVILYEEITHENSCQ